MANSVLKSVPYNAVEDSTTVARVGELTMLVVMSPKMPQRPWPIIAAAAQEKPADWTIATSGFGSAGHVASIE